MGGYHCILYYAGARNNCCKIHGVFYTDQSDLLKVLDDRERKIILQRFGLAGAFAYSSASAKG
jgi:hypothetical protein